MINPPVVPEVSRRFSEVKVVRTRQGGAEEVEEHVKALLNRGVKASDIAVLTRVNSTLLAPQIVLNHTGIECMNPVGPWFLRRRGVAAALAWLELASALMRGTRLPATALAAAARCPPRAISPRVVEWIAEKPDIRSIFYLADRIKDERTSERVAGFAGDVHRLWVLARKGANTVRLLEAVRDLGVGSSLEQRLDASRRLVDRSAHGDDLRALLSVAHLHEDPTGFKDWLTSQLSSRTEQGVRSGVESDTDTARREWSSGVRLSTIHRVKGMEWPHVIVFAASDGLMPHRLSSDAEGERRVFHVAITRCSESLLIITDGPDSPYLAELTQQAPVFEEPADPKQLGGNGGESVDPKWRSKGSSGGVSGVTSEPVASSSESQLSIGDGGGASGVESVGSRRSKGSGGGASDGSVSLSSGEKVLYERLREWRLERSRADDVPAFVVFSNKVMTELVCRRPVTDEALLEVPGIGPAKLADYGSDLKRLLSDPVNDEQS